ncbi:MAG: hypothetical protein ACSLFO_01015 [Acidimicrobiales bacterium]
MSIDKAMTAETFDVATQEMIIAPSKSSFSYAQRNRRRSANPTNPASSTVATSPALDGSTG